MYITTIGSLNIRKKNRNISNRTISEEEHNKAVI